MPREPLQKTKYLKNKSVSLSLARAYRQDGPIIHVTKPLINCYVKVLFDFLFYRVVFLTGPPLNLLSVGR